MDANTVSTVASPGLVTAIGLTTVFAALLALVGMLTLMGRLIGPKPAAKAEAAPKPAADAAAGAGSGPDEDVLRAVAIAAFALHQSHRITVRGAEPPTAWGQIARVQALRNPIR